MRTATLLSLLFLAACGRPSNARPEHAEPNAIDTLAQAARITAARARDLFEIEVLAPLKAWRFGRDPKRYYVADHSPRSERTSFLAVESYTVTDLTGAVRRNPSLNVPYVGRVTFTSSYEIQGNAADALIPPHVHGHTYQLINGHWRLESQCYSIGALNVDCMVGHLSKSTWRAEAMCIDESDRLIAP